MDARPGFNSRRLVELMRTTIERCQLDLNGSVVLTEAATGAYVVTPIVAAMAGADQVFAVTRSSKYGSIEQVCEQTHQLAALAGVSNRIKIVTRKTREIVASADIITNSGHLRPIDGEIVSWMKPVAVIPLMYEAWELRPDDVDVAACRRHGIRLAGTNERHPELDVFSYLGVTAIKLLLDAGVAVYRSRILVLCDNSFADYIKSGLVGVGAQVDLHTQLTEAATSTGVKYDAVLVALQPGIESVLGVEETEIIGKLWPGAVVAQFWGDLDRNTLATVGLSVWPAEPPAAGHMGILLSELGPEPIVRLQTGGLKVGEILSNFGNSGPVDLEYCQFLDDQPELKS
ncbi:MAG: hypothetical protein RKO24_00925 [Candidatus Competibacter sp.]|nr:hypothetical protein [Candidatus Competibacter sp.]